VKHTILHGIGKYASTKIYDFHHKLNSRIKETDGHYKQYFNLMKLKKLSYDCKELRLGVSQKKSSWMAGLQESTNQTQKYYLIISQTILYEKNQELGNVCTSAMLVSI